MHIDAEYSESIMMSQRMNDQNKAINMLFTELLYQNYIVSLFNYRTFPIMHHSNLQNVQNCQYNDDIVNHYALVNENNVIC